MGSGVGCVLEAKDLTAMRALAEAGFLEQLHRDDRPLVSPVRMRRCLSRRYRSDVIAANGSVATFGNGRLTAFAIYGDGQQPISGVMERHLLDLVYGSAAAGHMHELLAGVLAAAHADRVGRVHLEVSAHGHNAAYVRTVARELGFIDLNLVLRRTVARSSFGPGRFQLTPEELREFALGCLTQGIAQTFSDPDTALLKRISRFVRRRFGRLHTSHRFSAVALDEIGSPRAHALVTLVPSPFRDALEATLIDIFVPPQWKGEGWSIRLWQYVQHVLHGRGIDRAEGTLFLNGAPVPDELVNSLAGEGWWIDRYAMACPIKG